MRLIIIIIALILFSGCSGDFLNEKEDVTSEDFKIEKKSEIQQIKLEKPVKIKLKRDTQGRYSWELSGENPDEIIKTDRRLRRALGSSDRGQ